MDFFDLLVVEPAQEAVAGFRQDGDPLVVARELVLVLALAGDDVRLEGLQPDHLPVDVAHVGREEGGAVGRYDRALADWDFFRRVVRGHSSNWRPFVLKKAEVF